MTSTTSAPPKLAKPSHRRHRRKAIPVTAHISSHKDPSTTRFKKSSQETARLIRRFHVLNKELAKCRAAGDAGKGAEIEAEMESMGGLDWYQKASTLGQSKRRGGDSSKWLVGVLEEEGIKEKYKDFLPLRLLDVGALSPSNYTAHSSWIRATPIDLNPQHLEIRKQDFLKMTPPTSDDERFDVVCLSLVVNFVGDPVDRGTMLLHALSFLHPLTSSSPRPSPRHLYLVLPLPCLTNSRYMSHDHLLCMMRSLGYARCVRHHHSNKLAYYLFEWSEVAREPVEWRKRALEGREGGARNNFCIVVKET